MSKLNCTGTWPVQGAREDSLAAKMRNCGLMSCRLAGGTLAIHNEELDMSYDPHADAVGRMMERARRLPPDGAEQPSSAVAAEPAATKADAGFKSSDAFFSLAGIVIIFTIAWLWVDHKYNKPGRVITDREAWVQDAVIKMQRTDATFPNVTVEKPLIGEGRRMTSAHHRYCYAESIRIIGAKNAATAPGHATPKRVDEVNLMVEDYNSRCGSYFGKKGERGGDGLYQYSAELEDQGRRRLTPAPGAVTALPVPAKPTGPDAAREFQRLPTKDLSGLTPAERLKLEAACEESRVRGPQSYSTCLNRGVTPPAEMTLPS